MLLQEFWDDRYVGYCERLREVTRVGYESAWRCHVEPVFGSMELADIGVDDIELWLSGFASPGAARKAWAVLRQMLRKAAKWGYLEVDVTRLEIDLPAKPLHVPRLLTIGQTRRQLQGFYGHALEAWLSGLVSGVAAGRGVRSRLGGYRYAFRHHSYPAWSAMGGRPRSGGAAED